MTLKRKLQKLGFCPTAELIRLLPSLRPADQARICETLLAYLYSKPSRNEGKRLVLPRQARLRVITESQRLLEPAPPHSELIEIARSEDGD